MLQLPFTPHIQGIIQKTVRHLREVTNDLTIITDVCLCQYINHGHCGVIKNDKIQI